MRVLNSYATQTALDKALKNKSGVCKCKLAGSVEGVTLTVGEKFGYSEWIDPQKSKAKKEYLLIYKNTPLVSISKLKFEKHFNIEQK